MTFDAEDLPPGVELWEVCELVESMLYIDQFDYRLRTLIAILSLCCLTQHSA